MTQTLKDTKLGDRIRVYLDSDERLVCDATGKSIIATVIKIHHETGGRDLAWEKDEKTPKQERTEDVKPGAYPDFPKHTRAYTHRGDHVECQILGKLDKTLGDTKVGDRVRVCISADGNIVGTLAECTNTIEATVIRTSPNGYTTLAWKTGETACRQAEENTKYPGFVKVVYDRGGWCPCEIISSVPASVEPKGRPARFEDVKPGDRLRVYLYENGHLSVAWNVRSILATVLKPVYPDTGVVLGWREGEEAAFNAVASTLYPGFAMVLEGRGRHCECEILSSTEISDEPVATPKEPKQQEGQGMGGLVALGIFTALGSLFAAAAKNPAVKTKRKVEIDRVLPPVEEEDEIADEDIIETMEVGQ